MTAVDTGLRRVVHCVVIVSRLVVLHCHSVAAHSVSSGASEGTGTQLNA